MSGLDGLRLDDGGFLDMDQFPADGAELAGTELATLQEALRSDPIAEPSDAEWDAMFDAAVDGELDLDAGPFALDGVDDVTPPVDAGADDPLAALDDDPTDDDGTLDDGPADDGDPDLDLDTDIDDVSFDDGGAFDPFDDGGLDLQPDDGIDDGLAVDGVDDVPEGIANNDFEDLL